MPLHNDLDIHAHSGPLRPNAILCVDPTETPELPDGEGLMSVGVHPWNAGRVNEETMAKLAVWLKDERVVAVGEVGLDRLKGPEMDLQQDVFRKQILLASQMAKPLIIHCVRAFDLLLKAKKEMPAEGTQWILHGFRGNPILANQLLSAGIDLSFGEKYNAESFAATPAHRRYRETDR